MHKRDCTNDTWLTRAGDRLGPLTPAPELPLHTRPFLRPFVSRLQHSLAYFAVKNETKHHNSFCPTLLLWLHRRHRHKVVCLVLVRWQGWAATVTGGQPPAAGVNVPVQLGSAAELTWSQEAGDGRTHPQALWLPWAPPAHLSTGNPVGFTFRTQPHSLTTSQHHRHPGLGHWSRFWTILP